MDLSFTSTPFPKSVRNAHHLLTLATGQGGGTINRWNGHEVQFTSGFIVGGITPSLVLHPDTQVDTAAHLVARFMDRQEVSISLIGSWRDENTGHVHIDAVQWIDNRLDAELLGLERGELAIWDCANAEEIRLK